MLSDRAIGSALLVVNTAFMVYFMLWIGFMPFVDQQHFTQAFFPPREYGLLLAALIMTTGLGLSVTLASIHTILKTGYHEGAPSVLVAATAVTNAVDAAALSEDCGAEDLDSQRGAALAHADPFRSTTPEKVLDEEDDDEYDDDDDGGEAHAPYYQTTLGKRNGIVANGGIAHHSSVSAAVVSGLRSRR